MMDGQEKIFVTGATGFIGVRLVHALVQRGLRVRALCRRDAVEHLPGFGGDARAPLEHELVELVRGDITDADSLQQGMRGCTRVFHLAAYAKNWAPDPMTYDQVNVQGMQNVFDAARQNGVKRIVWTSTIMTLGPTPAGVIGDESRPRTNANYLTRYEETKTIAEQQALRQAADGLPVVIVNPTRVYGPGNLTEGNALSRLIDLYDRGKAPILLNRGVNVGNYVLVDDVVQGHLLAMERGRIGERYILGGENITLREFFRAIDRVSGKRHIRIPMLHISPLVFAHFQQWRAERFGVYPAITPGWIRTLIADWAYSSEKATRELGYQPTPLDDGLELTYRWLQRVRKESV